MLGCVLVLDILKAHKDQMSCELRSDSVFIKKYWNLVIESTGFGTVVLAKKISEKMSWECGGSFSNLYKLGMVIVVKLIGSLDHSFLLFYTHCISISAWFWNLFKLRSEISFLLGSASSNLRRGLCTDCPEEWSGKMPDVDMCMNVHEGLQLGVNMVILIQHLLDSDLFWVLYIS